MPPEILDTVDRGRLAKAIIVIGIFHRAVVHPGMAIADIGKAGVAAQFVSVDVTADTDVGGNERL